MALPVALFAMISSMALAGAAVVATIDVQQGAHRDDSTKRAIAAADAGANIAATRQKHYGYVLNQQNPCLKLDATSKLMKTDAEVVGGQQWCPPVSGNVGTASYVYRVSPVGLACGQEELCIVSTGTVDQVSRRIEVTYDRSSAFTNDQENSTWLEQTKATETKLGQELEQAKNEHNLEKIKELEEKIKKIREEQQARAHLEGLVGRDGIVLSGNAGIKNMGVGTNGSIEASGNATICGDIRHGIGKKWLTSGNAHQCSGYNLTEGNIELPPVSSFIPLSIGTVNSNYRLVTCTATNVPSGCQSDTLTGGNWGKNSPFDVSGREIKLTGNEVLTVGGGDYWVCAINMSGNSQLIIAKGAKVRFFFDTPEHCGTGSQLSLSGNNRISATGYQPSAGQFEVPGFYFLGSKTKSTSVDLSGNQGVTNELVVYGPDTYINISGNAAWKGIIAGRQITMSGNGTVEQDAGFPVPPELNPPVTEESTEIKKIEEEIKQVQNSTTETDEEKQQKETVLNERLEELKGKTNSGPVYFTPQSYFECTGAAAAGEAPNASC